jgi:hypothetical protein
MAFADITKWAHNIAPDFHFHFLLHWVDFLCKRNVFVGVLVLACAFYLNKS